MAKAAAAFAVGLLLSACSSVLQSGAPIGSSPTQVAMVSSPIVGVSPTAPPGAQLVAGGGCGDSPVYHGAIPPWASVNAPADLNYVIANPDLAMGYLFSYPLKAGPDSNKILWYVRAPRGGQALDGQGHPVGASQPTVSFTQGDNSGPGEIYPSGVTAPSPGCWHFHITWNGYAADVDLLFH